MLGNASIIQFPVDRTGQPQSEEGRSWHPTMGRGPEADPVVEEALRAVYAVVDEQERLSVDQNEQLGSIVVDMALYRGR